MKSLEPLERLRQMMRIRRFEEKAVELYSGQKIRGFLHLYIGEEAVAVGAIGSLRPDDPVVSNYRDHGHALARGVPMNRVMAEMFGKIQGCSHGRGGSMHLFDVSRNFYGGSAIVGGGIPIALGMALAKKLTRSDSIVACFFGDGAIASGTFHESLNMAVLWELPIVFFCENNFYAMGTALERHESQTDLTLKAASYRIETAKVDGMDVEAVASASSLAIEQVRSQGRPYFVEFQTYRFRAHSMFDPELYRLKTEVEDWKKRDPITIYKEKLKARGVGDDEQIRAIEDKVSEEVQDAVEYAENGSPEPVDAILNDVYASEVRP